MTVIDDTSVAETPARSVQRFFALRRPLLRVEHVFYLGLLALGLLLRLWQLDARALHHDETLHAAFSWRIFVGQGYVHDPLLHGPLLYYLNALVYFLFGDNDYTARLAPALFGTALIGLPYLLRQQLGRGTALLAAIYLTISPVFLYMSRFIRHDIYAVVFELLVFIAIVRYASSRQPGWLYLGAAALALMYVNLETTYLYLVVVGSLLVLTFLWKVWKPGIALVGALAVALVLLVFVLPAEAQKNGENVALRDPVTQQMLIAEASALGWPPLETDDNAYALRVRHRPDDNLGAYLQDLGLFFGHPAILTGMGLGLLSLGLLWWAIWRRKQPDGVTAWQAARSREDGLLAAFASLGERRRLLIAGAILFSIYGLFFTAFLTNGLGLITGTSGSLLYWLAQHGVRRGGQPWYYYLVLLPLYEPLLVLGSSAGLAMIGSTLARRSFRRSRADRQPEPVATETTQWSAPASPSAPAVLLLAWWALGTLLIYSWAGEKMPWLLLHVALPLVLLAAWAFDRGLRWGLGRWISETAEQPASQTPLHFRSEERPTLIYLGVSSVLAVLFFTWLNLLARTPASTDVNLLPWIVLAGLVLAGLLTLACGFRWGWRWMLGAVTLTVALLGMLHTSRSSLQLNYRNGDIPREMLIYVQTTPDVARVVRALEQASIRRTAGLDLPIIYDNETVWDWYLRDFRNATQISGRLDGPPGPEIQAVLISTENIYNHPENLEYLSEFRLQRYPLNWWLPEERVYRLYENWQSLPPEQQPLLGRALTRPFEAETFSDLWRYLVFRDPGAPLGAREWVIAVRPGLANEIGIGTGADSPNNP